MVIIIKDCIEACQTNEEGLIIQKAIRNVKGNSVVLDFHNLDFVSSSFVNTAFVEIIEEIGIEEFKNMVKIKNVNGSIAQSLRRRFMDF